MFLVPNSSLAACNLIVNVFFTYFMRYQDVEVIYNCLSLYLLIHPSFERPALLLSPVFGASPAICEFIKDRWSWAREYRDSFLKYPKDIFCQKVMAQSNIFKRSSVISDYILAYVPTPHTADFPSVKHLGKPQLPSPFFCVCICIA